MAGAKLKVGIIGANWGRTHIEAWRRVPDVEVAAICTSRRESAEAAAAENGVPRAYWNALEMVADPSLDIIDLTPRPSIRTPITKAALLAGKHVITPLAFADSLERGEELADIAERKRVVAMIENLHRFAPAFRTAKRMIEDGFLGRIGTVRGQIRTNNIQDRPPAFPYKWIMDRGSGASVVRNYGAQLLHVLTWMFGPVQSIFGHTRINLPEASFTDGSTRVNETEDTGAFLVDFAAGFVGSMELCWYLPAPDGFTLDAAGTEGRLLLTAPHNLGPQDAVLMAARRGEETMTRVAIPEEMKTVPASGLRADEIGQDRGFELSSMCYHMTRAVRGEPLEDAGPTFSEARKVMRTIEAGYRSSETKSLVRVT